MKADLEEAKSVLLDRKSHAEIEHYQEIEAEKLKEAEMHTQVYQKVNGFAPAQFEIVE